MGTPGLDPCFIPMVPDSQCVCVCPCGRTLPFPNSLDFTLFPASAQSVWLCLVTKSMAFPATEAEWAVSHSWMAALCRSKNYKLDKFERSSAQRFNSIAIAEYFRCRRKQSPSAGCRYSNVGSMVRYIRQHSSCVPYVIPVNTQIIGNERTGPA